MENRTWFALFLTLPALYAFSLPGYGKKLALSDSSPIKEISWDSKGIV